MISYYWQPFTMGLILIYLSTSFKRRNLHGMSKKSSLLLDELLPSTGLSLKLLINVFHFLRYLKMHLNGWKSVKKPSRT